VTHDEHRRRVRAAACCRKLVHLLLLAFIAGNFQASQITPGGGS
jgi:hypothetical protein